MSNMFRNLFGKKPSFNSSKFEAEMKEWLDKSEGQDKDAIEGVVLLDLNKRKSVVTLLSDDLNQSKVVEQLFHIYDGWHGIYTQNNKQPAILVFQGEYSSDPAFIFYLNEEHSLLFISVVKSMSKYGLIVLDMTHQMNTLLSIT